MEMNKMELIIIGSGAAGLSAAISANNRGIEDILIVERGCEPGGILNQCIHEGFGLHYFKENLTGPEYATLMIREIKKRNIKIMTDTYCKSINDEKIVTLINETGIKKIRGEAIIIATGAREKHIGEIKIPGYRPAGIYTGGMAQEIINKRGLKIGNEAVILGSGDIGLIMARRLTLQGVKVKAIIEIKNYVGGMIRNIKTCVEDYNIPVILNSTIKDIRGIDRVEEVVVEKLDNGEVFNIKCDTLITSIGLCPDLTLAINSNIKTCKEKIKLDNKNQCSIEGVFCCGNSVSINSLVDNVSYEGEYVGKIASQYIKKEEYEFEDKKEIIINNHNNGDICIICPKSCVLHMKNDKLVGNKCDKGKAFFYNEIKNKNRVLTDTIKIRNSKYRLPIKTSKAVNINNFPLIIEKLKNIEIDKISNMGEVIIKNVFNTEVDIIVCKDMICDIL